LIQTLFEQVPSIGGDSLGFIFNLIYLLLFLIFMLYGQKIQMLSMLREVGGAVDRLKVLSDEARGVSISSVKEMGKPDNDPTERIDQFLEYFTVLPVGLDPAGIVPKIEHILDVRHKRFEDEIRKIAPAAADSQVSNIEGVLEVALGLNYIYRIIRHFYLLGKKTMSYIIIMQIQMQLPLILREAEAYSAASKAFAHGQPIGDGAGALVAAKMMHGKKAKIIAEDIVATELSIDKRRVFVLKAEGPGAKVGKYGDAIKKLVKKCGNKVSMIVMVDAAGKFEGEETGTTAEGVGTAIGGIGDIQFRIEEVASKYKIPLNAVVVKESVIDSVAPMKKAIIKGVDEAIQKVQRLISEKTKRGDVIIVVGIGNTVGIGQ